MPSNSATPMNTGAICGGGRCRVSGAWLLRGLSLSHYSKAALNFTIRT